MLTNVTLKNMKSKGKIYKVADRDGMYVAVTPSGQITFRYDYRLNGRRETLTIGRYGRGGISLAAARERCGAARKLVAEGRSPAQEKGASRGVLRLLKPSEPSVKVGSRKRAWRRVPAPCGRQFSIATFFLPGTLAC